MAGKVNPKDTADLLVDARWNGGLPPALVAAVRDGLLGMQRVPTLNNRRPDLTPQEVRVLEWRHGLDGQAGRTLREAGDAIGVTVERTRQIEFKALSKLRRMSDPATQPAGH